MIPRVLGQRAPEASVLEPAQAVRTQAAQDLLPWVDIFPQSLTNPYGAIWNVDGAGDVWVIDKLVYGVGLTGFLPPGAMLLMAPLKHKATLRQFILDHVTPGEAVMWQKLAPLAGYSGHDFARQPLTLLRPGDVGVFPEPADGVCFVPVSPWSPTHPAPISYLGLSYGPHPSPLVRCFLSRGAVSQRLGYTPVPGHEQRDAIDTVAPTGTTVGKLIGLGTTHVTIHFHDDTAHTSPLQRIQGVETGNYEVWWLMANGLWAHNPADDFDAAGRGAADGNHDVEVYAVPRSALRVYVRQISGNNFYWCLWASDLAAASAGA